MSRERKGENATKVKNMGEEVRATDEDKKQG